MARGMGRVQKTLKALVSKQFAAELKAAQEPHKWHDTHYGWGLIGAALALILGAVGIIVPTVIAARVLLAGGGVLWILAMFVMFRDAKSRIIWSIICSIPMLCVLTYLWRYHDPPPDFIASLSRIEAMVREIRDYIRTPKQPVPTPAPSPVVPPNATAQRRNPDAIPQKLITEIPQGNLRERALQLAGAIKDQVGRDGWPDRIFQQPGINKQKIEESIRYQSGYFRFRFLKDVIAIRDEFAEPFHLRDPALDEDLQTEATFEKADIPTDPRKIYAIAERLEALAQQK
jgi:hypothetical protein